MHKKNKFIRINYQNKAFTVLELSISMSIIAFLLTIGIGVFGKFNETERYRKTRESIEIIEQAIKSFYLTNNYIPCPAPPNAAEISASFGNSSGLFNSTTFECDMGVTSNNTGMVPVRTLQIPDEYAYDGWNRKFTYRIAKGLGSAATFNYKDSDNSFFMGDIKIVSNNGQDLTMINSAPPNNYGAAYVIISHGPNGEEAAWRKNNTTAPSSGASGVEAENTNHGDNKTYIQDIRTYNFDDIVAFKQKNFFTVTKRGRSPFYFDSRVCSNAKTLEQTPLTSGGNITTGLVSQVTDTAQAIKILCNSTPSYCTFKPTDISNLTIWLDGSDPNGDGIQPASGASLTTFYNKAGTGVNGNNGTRGSPTFNSSTSFVKPGILFTDPNGQISFNAAPVNSDFTIAAVFSVMRGAMVANFNGAGFCNAGREISALLWPDRFGDTIAPYAIWEGANVQIKFGMCVLGALPLSLNTRAEDFYNVPVIVILNLNLAGSMFYGGNIYFYNKDGLYLHENNALTSVGANIYNQLNMIGFGLGTNGFLGEYLVYGKTLNAVERSKVVEYLSNRWFSNVCN